MIFEGQAIKADFIEAGIAELVLDHPGSVNKFDRTTLAEFKQCIDALADNAQIQALILRSAKPAFIVGADITEFIQTFKLEDPELLKWIKNATDIFDALEDLPFATISAINGFALGGGCETILATDYRVLDETAQIGLPEVKLGIMPGFGGTVRLSRLIGADNAMEWITTGKTHKPQECLAVGFADSVVSSDKLESAALNLARKLAHGEFNWQAKRAEKLSPLNLSVTEKAMSFNVAKGMVFAKVGNHYPAPHAAIECIERGADHSREQAMAIENEIFVRLAKTPEAEAQVGIFMADQLVKGKAKKATKTVDKTERSVVIGAGIMGGGIAYQSAYKGTPITMLDVSQAALDLGQAEAAKLLVKQVERGRIDAAKQAKVLNQITPSMDYKAVATADIVVEAVTENPAVKAKVLAQAGEHLNENAVLTTNTSTISIDQLAESINAPERFCGMHFFNPVHKMPLVEVIRGKATDDASINKVVSYAQQLGKTPIVVNDCPGFFVNRVLFPYFAAFNQLLVEGVDFATIDKVMEKQFGWPMGPAYLLDVVGLDTACHAQKVMAAGFPERMPVPENNLLEVFYQAERLGQKNGQGFYHYGVDKKGRPKKSVDEISQQIIEQSAGQTTELDSETIIARLMIPMINECIRCLEEGIIASAEEADMALILGLGFPPFRGGPFRYLQQMGMAQFIEQAKAFEHLGAIYQTTQGLAEKTAEQQSYLAQ
ncbi:fatty acid oxidation complex subunit alpha FadB [Catenovulum sp. SM1970]|uniref:fatty acid oxidation complex subunit alpha FadB n=1 Tax=Marinifaba aquimaris TaxID=2741323 RepID=UPI001573434A|nr:fatty acid oxidation complex subunit alpha FadB [Marinifaba aquimaris]NTS76821.1 fatty acid oxidation complex subunit alpha FadB [Marinifaba aquimaris]